MSTRTPASPPNNLPLQVTSLVGREHAVGEVQRWLGTAGVRLVTLTGAGGTGKTRLALQVAAEALARYPNGAWFVDLAPLSDPAPVPQAVASALSLREAPDQPLLATLVHALRTRCLLLILDNCEHLLDACAGLADALIRGCPTLQVLATSREPLGIAGETVWPVPSLTVPPVDGLTPASGAAGSADPPAGLAAAPLTARAAGEFTAVRLFLERTTAVAPRFALTDQNAATVAQLCHRLDGIPLAIELAAARVRALSVEQLLERLQDRFRLLTGGSRTTIERHQTLQAAVDWSYALLEDAERSLFERLAVFAGGFTLEAAEQVCSDPADGTPFLLLSAGTGQSESTAAHGELRTEDVLDLLARLVDKSLVVAEEDTDGRTRYRLLETLRQYALERLVTHGQVDRWRHLHAAYFTTFAESVEPQLEGPDQGRWFDRQEREHDNCRVALRWAVDHPDLDTGECAMRLAAALWRFWWIRGYRHDARAWREAVLALPVQSVRSAAWAKVAIFTSPIASAFWQLDQFDEALAVLRERGQRREVAAALAWHAVVLRHRGDSVAAAAAAEESLALFSGADDLQSAGTLLNSLAGVAVNQRDYGVALGYYEEILAHYRAAGNLDRTAAALNSLGHIARAQGDLARSRALHEEARAIWEELGYIVGLSGTLRGLGAVALAEADFDTAHRLLDESAGKARVAGLGFQEARVLVDQAVLARATGDASGARAHLERARGLWREDGLEHPLAPALEELAFLAAAHGHAERALRVAGAAAALRDAISFRLNDAGTIYVRHRLAAAFQALDGAAAAAALAAGEQLTPEQAIDEALDWPTPGAPEHGGTPTGRETLPATARPAPAAPATAPAIAADSLRDDLARAPDTLQVDTRTYDVTRGGHALPARLSAQEFALVAYLYERADRVCTRQELGDALWGARNWEPNMLYRLIGRVRDKLEPDPAQPRYLHSVPGIGYRLIVCPVTSAAAATQK